MAALGFIPASEKDAFSVRSEPISSNRSSKLSGEEVRRFYEDLMKDDTTRAERSKRATNKNNHDRGSNRRARRAAAERVQQENTDSVAQRDRRNQREAVNSERVQELMGLRLLRCAHQGDISGLKELISKGVDINFQDTYLWTAVMCASWAGQQDAVRLLLRQGAAWVGVVDTRGRDAQDLAREAGHEDVLNELLNYGRSPQREATTESSLHQPQWCDICRCEFRTSHSSHLSSTLHQFSEHHPQPSPYYCLPPSSNSYKMMVRCGWKPGTGLGPEADGPKQPVSTVLKRDHKGLGFGPVKRAKVTHFKAGDQSAVKHRPQDREERGRKGQKKDETKRREQKDRNWERDFRASFYQ
ncbi:PREDICTED: G patch domain and ankyrin repeat-containing protein 1 [Cyprinodon variegatus]|uniref:G-patch domain and ankyrin repeats 1 n=1 Tax=Cyprinodon variegatus TaxID=28743 RepID=A0A3Q2G4B8_CYPVA|nr:PREDICTED: G patch domain and ankyrin repeat-containing protein 1 [Cyprinodon variegatus]